MNYSVDEKIRAAAWKSTTLTLPEPARQPAPYVTKDGTQRPPAHAFCLPAEYATLTLLPEVREQALTLFAELGIPWHAGIADGPSNHLLSSQVQCVNALGQMASDPARLREAFGNVMAVGEILEIEPGRFMTFEYIGPTDFFGEAPGADRTRGARCTSVDAAFLHQAPDGVTELVLVEWKYTESYRVRTPDPMKDAVRLRRYGAAVADPAGPIRDGVLPFACLLDEPFYQLVRQQLLAWRLEQTRADCASRVRVVHVLPADNVAYRQSLARSEHRALGGSVSEVWQQLLRYPDRFVPMDSAAFLDPDVTSTEYVRRYGYSRF